MRFFICILFSYLILSIGMFFQGYQDKRNPIDFPFLYGGLNDCEKATKEKELLKKLFPSYELGCWLGE